MRRPAKIPTPHEDVIQHAIRREREARKVVVPESTEGSFTCQLCGHRKADDRRREPESEICIDCVIEAGFGYD